MLKTDDDTYEGNDRYEGYCKDLADLISNHVGFKYTLKLVNDSKYGGIDSNSLSGWTGMVGELILQVNIHLHFSLRRVSHLREQEFANFQSKYNPPLH